MTLFTISPDKSNKNNISKQNSTIKLFNKINSHVIKLVFFRFKMLCLKLFQLIKVLFVCFRVYETVPSKTMKYAGTITVLLLLG